MQVVGYVRVSTQEQAAEGMSLEAQERRIRAWAEAVDADLADLVRDEGCRARSSSPTGPAAARSQRCWTLADRA